MSLLGYAVDSKTKKKVKKSTLMEGKPLNIYFLKKGTNKTEKASKDSNRITKEYDNNNMLTKIIYLYIPQKNVLSTNLWNKNKSQKKKPHFGNIEYNGREICTIVRCFAFK